MAEKSAMELFAGAEELTRAFIAELLHNMSDQLEPFEGAGALSVSSRSMSRRHAVLWKQLSMSGSRTLPHGIPAKPSRRKLTQSKKWCRRHPPSDWIPSSICYKCTTMIYDRSSTRRDRSSASWSRCTIWSSW